MESKALNLQDSINPLNCTWVVHDNYTLYELAQSLPAPSYEALKAPALVGFTNHYIHYTDIKWINKPYNLL